MTFHSPLNAKTGISIIIPLDIIKNPKELMSRRNHRDKTRTTTNSKIKIRSAFPLFNSYPKISQNKTYIQKICKNVLIITIFTPYYRNLACRSNNCIYLSSQLFLSLRLVFSISPDFKKTCPSVILSIY